MSKKRKVRDRGTLVGYSLHPIYVTSCTKCGQDSVVFGPLQSLNPRCFKCKQVEFSDLQESLRRDMQGKRKRK